MGICAAILLCPVSAVQRRRDQFLGSVLSLCLLMHRHCHEAPVCIFLYSENAQSCETAQG